MTFPNKRLDVRMTIVNRPALSYALLGGLVIAYVALLMTGASFSPTDDVIFVDTLMQGKELPIYGRNFPYYDAMSFGRFIPFSGREYDAVRFFTAPSATSLFAVNAIQLVMFAGLMLILTRQAAGRQTVFGVMLVAALLFVPGFTNAWFRLPVGERSTALYMALFLVSFLRYRKTGSIIAFMAALAGANAALYYKEPSFLAIGVFAMLDLLARWRSLTVIGKSLNYALMGSAALYIILYVTQVYIHRGPMLYSDTTLNPLLVAVKNIANYALLSDPAIIFVLWPLTGWRAYRLIKTRGAAYVAEDAMLAAGSVYTLVFLTLNIYSPYYFLPAYVFAIPAFVRFLGADAARTRFWKTMTALVLAIMAVNAIPLGLHYLTYNKYVAINFNDTMDALVKHIGKDERDGKARIFIDGVDRGNGADTYFIYGQFLKYKGLRPGTFDMLSNVESNCLGCPRMLKPELTREYTVFKNGELPRIEKGDYLVVGPQANMAITEDYLRSLDGEFTLLFRTESPLAIPQIGAKTVVKAFLMKFLDSDHLKNGVIVNRNLMVWPDYFVFRHR